MSATLCLPSLPTSLNADLDEKLWSYKERSLTYVELLDQLRRQPSLPTNLTLTGDLTEELWFCRGKSYTYLEVLNLLQHSNFEASAFHLTGQPGLNFQDRVLDQFRRLDKAEEPNLDFEELLSHQF